MDPFGWRVAVGRRRLADGAGDVPAGPPAHRLDAARLRRRPAALLRRPAVRAVPAGAARHLPGVLPALRGRLPGRRPRLGPRPAGPAGARPGRPTPRDWGPVRALLCRPVAAGRRRLLGPGLGTKWDGVYPLAAFGLLVWLWDAGARRSFGVRWPRAAARSSSTALPAFVLPRAGRRSSSTSPPGPAGCCTPTPTRRRSRTRSTAPTGAATSSTTRTASSPSCGSRCGRCGTTTTTSTSSTPSSSTTPRTPTSPSPQGWLILNRPVGVRRRPRHQARRRRAATRPPGSTCLRQVLLLGTPALWWGGVLALLYAGLRLGRRARLAVRRRGRRRRSPPGCRGSAYDDRPIFSFYAIAIIPFTILAITLLPRQDDRRRRARRTAGGRRGTVVAGAFVVLVMRELRLVLADLHRRAAHPPRVAGPDLVHAAGSDARYDRTIFPIRLRAPAADGDPGRCLSGGVDRSRDPP